MWLEKKSYSASFAVAGGWFFYTGVNGLRCNADVCGQIMTVILPIIPTSAPGRNINININKANLGGFRTINISHR